MNVGTLQHQFLGLAIESGVLRFGEFTLKSGRPSPYFFNLGAVSGGMALARLGQCYARAWIESGIAADVLFGPAYKGIPVAVATAIAAAGMGRDIGVAYNRKEAKGHGEGGVLVGAAVTGRVLLVDDVLTAGTAVRESMDILATAGARPVGLLVAFDRRERGTGTASALEEVGQQYGIPVRAIATLDDLIDYQAARGEPVETLVAHREHHGAAAR